MRKGFTMIELIFVIVILGILAAVAIPRLTATRDDAEVAKIGTNLTTLISDLGAFYTSQGEFGKKLSQMTNVQLADAGASLKDELLAAGSKCVSIELIDKIGNDNKPAHLVLKAGTNNSLEICKKVLASKGVKDLLASKFSYTDKTTNKLKESNAGEIAISGISVKF